MYQRLYHNLKSSRNYTFFVSMTVLFVLILLAGCDSLGKPTTSGNASSSKHQPTSVPSSPRTFLGSGTALNPFQNVFMVNSQVGWLLSPSNTTHLFRTVDGGRSWKQVKIPQELSKKTFWTYVFDADMALLQPFQDVGGPVTSRSFYRTVDAGATWQQYNWPPTTIETDKDGGVSSSWTFLDHMHGWAMTPPPPQDDRPALSGNQMLFRTNDGGQTWQFVAHLPLKYGGDHLTFLDAHTGWLVTTVDKPGHTSPNDPQAFSDVLYVTHDGGHTWKQSSVLPLPAYRTPRAFYLTFFSQREGYLGPYIQDDKLYIYMTRDGGNTWQVRGSALPGDVKIKGEVGVVDATHFNDESFLYTLTNGQWVKTSSPVPVPGNSIPVVDFASSQVGLAFNPTGMYRTDDGGKHWKKLGVLPQDS